MNCAVELLVVQGIALDKKHQEELELEKRRAKKVAESTIEWCETIVNDALLASASRGDAEISCSFPVRMLNDEFAVLSHEISRTGNEYYLDKGGWKNWNVMREYLSRHCISMRCEHGRYRCFNGGIWQGSTTLCIYINKADCLS